MRSIESDGDSIDEAIEKALEILQVSRDRVAIEILADSSKGLFGFGGKRARVRATVRAPLSSSLDEPGASGSGALRHPEPEAPASERQGSRASAFATRRVGEPSTGDERFATPAELAARAKPILEELLGYLGAACRVEVQAGSDPGTSVLQVTGEGSGLVIGRRGQTLDALEYLVNRIVSRAEEAAGRVMIDVEQYRERRKEYLEQLAHRLADKAKQTGRPVTLNPMSPRDRRIVHLTLQDDGQVNTRSFGEGVFRKMTIYPAGQGHAQPRRGHSA